MTSGPKPFLFEGTGEAKRFAPATERNRDAIADVLGDILPPSGMVLEVASGTGEHVIHFARRFPALDWQPSDPDEAALASIAAWSAEAGLTNIRAPLRLDAAAADWPLPQAIAILCINMVHIAPWWATEGLFAGAARLLAPDAPLYLYGPYRETNRPTADSNEAFDATLRERDPHWGLRNVDDMCALADASGFSLEKKVDMPANNLSLVFRKRAG